MVLDSVLNSEFWNFSRVSLVNEMIGTLTIAVQGLGRDAYKRCNVLYSFMTCENVKNDAFLRELLMLATSVCDSFGNYTAKFSKYFLELIDTALSNNITKETYELIGHLAFADPLTVPELLDRMSDLKNSIENIFLNDPTVPYAAIIRSIGCLMLFSPNSTEFYDLWMFIQRIVELNFSPVDEEDLNEFMDGLFVMIRALIEHCPPEQMDREKKRLTFMVIDKAIECTCPSDLFYSDFCDLVDSLFTMHRRSVHILIQRKSIKQLLFASSICQNALVKLKAENVSRQLMDA